jgi:hypothetical protein
LLTSASVLAFTSFDFNDTKKWLPLFRTDLDREKALVDEPRAPNTKGLKIVFLDQNTFIALLHMVFK